MEIISPDGGKKDRDYIRPKLAASKRYGGISDRAGIGMNLLERECIDLREPDGIEVRETIENLRRLYIDAYDWPAPQLEVETGGASYQRRMRYKVRAAINEWDLRRLDPDYRPKTEMDEFHHTYEENVDLERESKDDVE